MYEGPLAGHPRNEVLINGQRFPLAPNGVVHVSDQTPFIGRVAQGDPKYGDFTTRSHLEVRDLRGGLGLLYARDDKPGRFYDSTVDTRYPFQVALPPKLTLAVDAWKATGFGEIAGQVVAGSNNLIKSVVAAAWTTQTTSANSPVWQNFTRFSPSTGANAGTLYGIFFNGGASTNKNIAYSATGAAAWTEITPTGINSEILRFATIWDGKLYAFSDTSVYWTTDPTTAAWNTAFRGLPGIPTGAAVYSDAQGNEWVMMSTKDGLWRLNLNLNTFSIARDYSSMASAANGKSMLLHNGFVYVPTRRGLLQFTWQTQSYIGAGRDQTATGGQTDGLSPTYQGDIVRLQSDSEWLWMAVGNDDTRTGNILAWDGFGWHRMMHLRDSTTREAALGQIYDFYKTANGGAAAGYSRVWFSYRDVAGAADRVGYFEVPIATDNPLLINPSGSTYGSAVLGTSTYLSESAPANYPYEKLGDLTTSWTDAGFAEVPKNALEVDINAIIPPNCSVAVYYATDGNGDNETLLGTINGASSTTMATTQLAFTTTNTGDGLAFKYIRFRFRLTGDGSNSFVTPQIRYSTLRYIARPEAGSARGAKQTFNMTLDITNEALVGCGLNVDSARAALNAIRTSTILVPFQDDPSSEGTQYLVACANREDLRWWLDDERQSEATLVLTEV